MEKTFVKTSTGRVLIQYQETENDDFYLSTDGNCYKNGHGIATQWTTISESEAKNICQKQGEVEYFENLNATFDAL